MLGSVWAKTSLRQNHEAYFQKHSQILETSNEGVGCHIVAEKILPAVLLLFIFHIIYIEVRTHFLHTAEVLGWVSSLGRFYVGTEQPLSNLNLRDTGCRSFAFKSRRVRSKNLFKSQVCLEKQSPNALVKMVLDIVRQRTPPQRTACKGQLEQGAARLPGLRYSEDSNRKLLPPFFSLSFFFFNQEGRFIFRNKHSLCNLPACLSLRAGPITDISNMHF